MEELLGYLPKAEGSLKGQNDISYSHSRKIGHGEAGRDIDCMMYVPQDHSFLDETIGLLWGSNINQHSEGFGRGFSKAGTLMAHMHELNLT